MKSNSIYRSVSFFLLIQLGLSQNHSLSFDGAGDYVSINAANVSKPCTAEFWVKRRSDTHFQILLDNQNNFSLRLEQYSASNKVGFTKNSTYDKYFNYVAPAEEWVHLAVVATTDSTTLFVNGAYYTKNDETNFNMPLSTIGKNGNNTLNANLDELRVWNVARSAYQISSSMSAELNGNESGLVAYYKMNSGSGTFLTDHSGNGNHGTISDATWSSDVPGNLASTNDLSGTYSIGQGADYATFSAAASALSSYGISGPVTFNVLNGTYDGDFSLNSISGTSEANTVTFQSFSGNAGDVILTDSYYYAS
ncbi:MAG: LamG domain-containing protein, partial [Candidatus Marinimicrobia bacterium]|nr:LamG domain-containing protein [Candidatus Neomarinimicrobiota bacterium]